MTFRAVCNVTSLRLKDERVSGTHETQEDGSSAYRNSPHNVNFDDTENIVFKSNEHRPCPAAQSGNLPVWVQDIPNFIVAQDVAMDPTIDVSGGCVAAVSFASPDLPTGLVISAAGVISGTATIAGDVWSTVVATNANGTATSNTFLITVTAP